MGRKRGTRKGGIRPTPHVPQGGGNSFLNNHAETAVARIEIMMRRRLREMCINRFKWEGLPPSIDPRFVETILYEMGVAVYLRPKEFISFALDADDMSGVDMVLRGTQAGPLDYQDNPLAFTCTSNGAYSGGTFSVKECVPIWSNTSRMPDLEVVNWYASRLAEAERTIDINLKNARHTRLITVPETQKLTALNMQQQMDNGQAVILTNETLDAAAYTSVDFNMDEKILQAVAVAKNQIMNDCLTMLGINNANMDKKERLIGGEVDARSEQVGVNRAIALGERERAVEKINKMFKTNITVTWNEEINKEIESEGITEDGKLHDGAKESD